MTYVVQFRFHSFDTEKDAKLFEDDLYKLLNEAPMMKHMGWMSRLEKREQ